MEQHINRAEQLWKNWEETRQGLERLAGADGGNDRTIRKLKYDFLRHGLYRLSVGPSEKEQLYLHVIRSVTAKLEKQLYPNPVVRALHRLKALVYDRPVHLKRFERQRSENLEQLAGQLKSAGFASFTGRLESYLDYERPIVTIPMAAQLPDRGSVDIEVKMERDRTGHYTFTGYRSELYRDGQLQQGYTFPAGSGITATEAAGLLQGRAVSKNYPTVDGGTERKWVQLDFRDSTPKLVEYQADYGYDLKKELTVAANGLGIDGLGREKTIRELEAGRMVTVEIPGKGLHYLHADPAGRSIRVLDSDKRTMKLSELIEAVRKERSAVPRPEVRLFKLQGNRKEHDHSLGING